MEYSNEVREVFGWILAIWLTSGLLIALGTWIIMWKREGFKIRIPEWWEVFEFFGMIGMITMISYGWLGLNIYWHYQDKRILRKIKEAKTSTKDLF